jgi:hypothetical protein
MKGADEREQPASGVEIEFDLPCEPLSQEF